MLEDDKETTGSMNKLEDASEYRNTLWDPIANNINTNRERIADEIYNTTSGGAQVAATGENQIRGSTGVKFHHYKYD